MTNFLLFIATVIFWGTTWIGISLQIGEVPVLTSIFLRFALAGLVMIAVLAAVGRLQRPSAWRFVVLQALCLFCFNFVGLYYATEYITSGLVAVIFSLASIFNAVNARIFFGDRITPRMILAGFIGAIGLLFIFWSELFISFDGDTILGIAWAVQGTLVFSLGNMASRRNSELGVPPITANGWGMPIGAIVLLFLVAVSGQPLLLSSDPVYWCALVYLAIVGSIIGFSTYLMLAERIGSVRASYATVVFPVVALVISTLFEGYNWTTLAMFGVALTIVGNIIMFWKPRKAVA